MADTYQSTATRARLGVIVPSVNTVVEPWFSAVVPSGVSVHVTRMLLCDALTADALREMDEHEGSRAARQIASCRPNAVAYCCTASSAVQGPEYDAALESSLARQTGVPSFTAIQALITALRATGARRIAIASPYSEAIDRMEQEFFVRSGFEVLGGANLGITDAFQLAEPSAATLHELGHAACRENAEALLLTCLNTRSHLVIDTLEAELKIPVITSTQATLWRLLRLSGIADRIEGYGRLLSRH
jgi:maleate isomerase